MIFGCGLILLLTHTVDWSYLNVQLLELAGIILEYNQDKRPAAKGIPVAKGLLSVNEKKRIIT